MNFLLIYVSNIVSISPECLAPLYPLLSGAMFGLLSKHPICPGAAGDFFCASNLGGKSDVSSFFV